MKRRVWVIGGLCAGVFAMVAEVRAQEPEPERPRQRDRFGRRPGRGPGQDPLRMELRFASQLREAVMNEIELTNEQKANLNRIFDEHAEALQSAGRRPREAQPDPEMRERLAELEEQLQAAQEAGDREEMRRLRQEMMDLRRGGQDRHAEELHQRSEELVETVKAELTEEQIAPFDEIVARIRAQSHDVDMIPRLMMAGRRAAARMELDEEQRRAVNDVLRSAVRDAMRDGGQEPEAVLESIRGGVVGAIGAELAEEFMAILQEEQSAMAARGPRRGGPPGKAEEPAPDQPEEEAPGDPDGGE